MMKQLITILFLLTAFVSFGQQPYLPSTDGQSITRPIGATGFPTDARSYYHDRGNFTYRPYQSTAEVLSTLNTALHRKGQFLIVVNTGGTLSGGNITGGTNALYWFKDGVADGNLVLFNPGGVPTGGAGVFSPELYFVNSASNPTFPNAAESSVLMQSNGTTADMWYHGLTGTPLSDSIIYYTTANNGLLNNWSLPGTPINIHGLFPTVFQIGSTYYMFLKNRGGFLPADFNTGDIYLYSSTNKTTWTMMNGGAPAITHSSVATDWRNKIFNVAVVVRGTTLHILCDGWASSGAYSANFSAGYATADISNPVFTLPATPTILNCANPDMLYVPEKNALLIAYNDIFYYPGDVYNSFMHFGKASMNTDLTNPKAWVQSPYYATSLSDTSLMGPYYPSDYSIVFTPGKTYPMMMTYCYAQNDGFQAYAPLINTPLELFESIPDYISGGGSSQWANVSGGIQYAGGNVTNTSSLAAATGVFVKNTNPLGSANVPVLNNLGYGGGLTVKGSTATTYGALVKNSFGLYSNLSNVYLADCDTCFISLATGGNTERMRLLSNGVLKLNVYTGPGEQRATYFDSTGKMYPLHPDSLFRGVFITENNLIKPTLGAGSLALQGLGVDNGVIMSNLKYVGSGVFKYRANGFGSFIQPVSGGFDFYTAPSGTAEANATVTNRFAISNAGAVNINGASSVATLLNLTGTHTGAARIGINHIPASGTNYNSGIDFYENSVAKWSVASALGTFSVYNQTLSANAMTISPASDVALSSLAGADTSHVGVTSAGKLIRVSGSGGGGSGTVTSVSQTMPSGFGVSIGNATTTPSIVVTTTLNGVVKGNGSGFTAGQIDTTDISNFGVKVNALIDAKAHDVYFDQNDFGGTGSTATPLVIANFNKLGPRKVVPDANYTVDSTDSYLILPDPAATRTLTLPAATARSKPITIYCASTSNGEWILSGGYVLKNTTGTNFTENFVNSGFATTQIIHLVPMLDGSTWRWFDL